MYEIEISDRQSRLKLDVSRLLEVTNSLLGAEGVGSASISLAFVDDPTMHALNRDYLAHDYPTDVLSFLLSEAVLHSEQAEIRLEGEVIVSTDTAAVVAQEYRWRIEDEILLYVVHGLLHLVGYDDHRAADREIMRRREREILSQWGLSPHYETMEDQPPETSGRDEPPAHQEGLS